ncbi:hypothetical protein ACM79U_11695 [Pseudomonas aeruginosa]
MNKALDLLRGLVSEVERKTCGHEETHRGGAIWEICDSCGAKWADDEGGKPEFAWPESVEKARAFLATHPAVEQACWDERKLSDLGNELHNLSCSIVHENEKLAEQIGGIARELWNWPQARAALAQPSGEVVVTKNESGAIVSVTRQDKEGRVLSVIAESQPSPAPADEKPGDSILCSGCFAKGVGPEHFDEAGKCLARQQTEPLGAEFAQVLSDNLPELLSTGQAEQAEAERPEVVAWQYRVTAGPQTGWSLWHPGKGEEFERSYTVERRPLMTVAQYERIVGELRAVIAQLRQHKNDYMDSGQETYRALQNEIREREAEIARLDGLVSGRTAERDAALARVAELEAKLADLEKQEPIGWFAQYCETPMRRMVQWGTKVPDCAADTFYPLYAAPVAQAQHGVPGKYDDVLLPFLKLMEHELHANAGKGDRPGWLQMDRKTALLEIYYHLGKLQKATRDNDPAGIVEYAADVANMAMMLVDVCGLLAAAPGKEVGHE